MANKHFAFFFKKAEDFINEWHSSNPGKVLKPEDLLRYLCTCYYNKKHWVTVGKKELNSGHHAIFANGLSVPNVGIEEMINRINRYFSSASKGQTPLNPEGEFAALLKVFVLYFHEYKEKLIPAVKNNLAHIENLADESISAYVLEKLDKQDHLCGAFLRTCEVFVALVKSKRLSQSDKIKGLGFLIKFLQDYDKVDISYIFNIRKTTYLALAELQDQLTPEQKTAIANSLQVDMRSRDRLVFRVLSSKAMFGFTQVLSEQKSNQDMSPDNLAQRFVAQFEVNNNDPVSVKALLRDHFDSDDCKITINLLSFILHDEKHLKIMLNALAVLIAKGYDKCPAVEALALFWPHLTPQQKQDLKIKTATIIKYGSRSTMTRSELMLGVSGTAIHKLEDFFSPEELRAGLEMQFPKLIKLQSWGNDIFTGIFVTKLGANGIQVGAGNIEWQCKKIGEWAGFPFEKVPMPQPEEKQPRYESKEKYIAFLEWTLTAPLCDRTAACVALGQWSQHLKVDNPQHVQMATRICQSLAKLALSPRIGSAAALQSLYQFSSAGFYSLPPELFVKQVHELQTVSSSIQYLSEGLPLADIAWGSNSLLQIDDLIYQDPHRLEALEARTWIFLKEEALGPILPRPLIDLITSYARNPSP